MRCTNCGLPLSPSRTNMICPRCGTPIGSGQKAPSTQAQQYQQVYRGKVGTVQAGAGTPPQNEQWAQTMQGSPSHPSLSPLPEYQQGVALLSQPTPRAIPPPNSRNTKLGFTVAGLCVLTGGLILVLVYFIAIGLPGGNSNNTVATPVVSKPTTAPTATTAPSSTTMAYPGQKYIDNAQMASAIDTASLQPTQLGTTFKTNQKIYVTFRLHPPGHSGAVCLLWYLSGRQVSRYSFAVGANSKLSYAYSIYGSTGAAYVEIYWASTPQCTDQVLAQHVDFTVTK